MGVGVRGGKTANNVSFYFWVGMVETDVRGGKKRIFFSYLRIFTRFVDYYFALFEVKETRALDFLL